jgi:hypothetical protein
VISKISSVSDDKPGKEARTISHYPRRTAAPTQCAVQLICVRLLPSADRLNPLHPKADLSQELLYLQYSINLSSSSSSRRSAALGV